MPAESNHISLNLTSEELEAVEALRKEMNLDDAADVLHMLLRQAQQRIAVVCPSCGHSAQRTTEDEARCNECLSVLHLTDGIWEVIHLTS